MITVTSSSCRFLEKFPLCHAELTGNPDEIGKYEAFHRAPAQKEWFPSVASEGSNERSERA
jgi:hypothetical protein